MRTPQPSKLEADYLDLHVLFQSLYQKKRLILCISLLTCIFSIMYVLFKPTKYQASVLLQVHHNQESSLGSISRSSDQAGKDNLTAEPVSVHLALIRSKFILGPVIQALNLDILVKPYGHAIFNTSMPSANSIQVKQLDVPISYFNKPLYLYIDSANHYRLYTTQKKLLLEGQSGELTTNNDFSIQIDNIKAGTRSQFSITKLPESEVINQIRSHLTITDLTGSSENFPNKPAILQLSLTGDNPNDVMQLINKIALITQQKDRERKSLEAKKTLAFLSEQLPIIQNTLKDAETKLNRYRSTSGKIDIRLQTQYLFNHLADIDKQLEITRLKKIDLLQQYTVHHPNIIALNDSYKELEKQRNEILLQIKNLTTTDQIATNLARDVNVQKNLNTLLLNQIHEQQVITAGIVSDIGILSLATSPDLSLPVKLSIIGVASLFLGFILGCLAVLIGRVFSRHASSSKEFLDEVHRISLADKAEVF